jgi:hypothetical protein
LILERAAEALAPTGQLAVVLGPRVFEYTNNEALVEALEELAGRKNTTFLPLYHGSNTRGVVELGAMGPILPGVTRARGKCMTLDEVLEGAAEPSVLYLLGDIPCFDRPACEYVIAQGTYHPPFPVDAFLPAASFAEAEGTLTNVEGRIQEVVQIEDLPDGAVTGFARPDWQIFSRLADKLSIPGLKYRSAKGVLKEISQNVPGFPSKPDRKVRMLAPRAKLPIERSAAAVTGTGPFLLVIENGGFAHRGVDLSSKVEGLEELGLDEGFRFHPDDLAKLRIEPGDEVTVSAGKVSVTGMAKSDPECPTGTIYVCRPVALGGLEHRAQLEPLYRHAPSPVKVKVQAGRRPSGKPKRKAKTVKTSAARR